MFVMYTNDFTNLSAQRRCRMNDARRAVLKVRDQ